MLMDRRRLHNLVCKQWADFQDRPSDDVRRVILLSEKADKPVFAWVPVKLRTLPFAGENDRNIRLTMAQFESLPRGACLEEQDFFDGEYAPSVVLVNETVGGGKLLGHSLFLDHLDEFMNRAPNPSLASLVGKPVAERGCGPLMIFDSGRVKHDDPIDLRDFDLSGFTLALNRIVHHHSGKDIPIMKTKGLKLNSSSPSVEEVDVPLKHPAFRSSQTIPMLEMMRLSVLTYKYPAKSSSAGDTKPDDPPHAVPTFDAAVLRLCIDTSSPDSGKIPPSFHDDTSSILLGRADRMPCRVRPFVVIVKYIKERFVPKVMREKPSTKEEREKALQGWIGPFNEIRDAVMGD